MKILLISIQGIGDTVLITPAIKYLYHQGHMVDALISNNGSHQIVKASGMVKNIYAYREEDNFFKNLFRLKKEIRGSDYDVVYAMYPNGKRENISAFSLSRKNKGGIKNRHSYWRTFGFLLRQTIALEQNSHGILRNLRLVGAPDTYRDCKPVIIIPHEIDESVKRRFFSNNDKRFLVVLHPFSAAKMKCWGLNNYSYVCQKLIREGDVRIVVAGSPRESWLIDDFVKGVGCSIESCVHDNILYAAALISQSNLFLGNDSSLMHIAAALGRPTVALWGFTDYIYASPYGANSLIIRKGLDCAPCYTFEYNYAKKCLRDIECLRELAKERIYTILSFLIGELKKGRELKEVNFEWDREIINIRTMQSYCKEIIIK